MSSPSSPPPVYLTEAERDAFAPRLTSWRVAAWGARIAGVVGWFRAIGAFQGELLLRGPWGASSSGALRGLAIDAGLVALAVLLGFLHARSRALTELQRAEAHAAARRWRAVAVAVTAVTPVVMCMVVLASGVGPVR